MTDESIFAEALLQTDPKARSAYLLGACGADAERRQRIEALLSAHGQADEFLTRSPAADFQTTAAMENLHGTRTYHEPIGEAGQIVAGKYKLLDNIGEGGMGSVWRAQQSEPVKRLVAVKLIKAGMDSKAVLARFEAERQALAVMDHPNIAKILDGGLHENRPFFVMELVKGVPITEYCDARKLTPQQRLELFVPVCAAIQHAHQKGIIHRDIKPSNVLIALYDDKPVVKVIDFGVAKATGSVLTDASNLTAFGGVVGTPQYMSPEQASLNNLDIDTRSDVYSLGVLLYELLTGSPPFSRKELEKKGLLEILRVVREEEAPRPSMKLSTADALPTLSANRGTEPKKLTGLLRNELDWIVMKALEKDRTRRYDTANGFAADVNRYLSGEAVLAHPPSVGYRIKKFVRRNRGQVIAASLVLLALLAGIAGTTVGLVQTRRANAALEAERAKVEQRFEMARKSIATFHTVITDEKALENDAFKDLRKKLLTEAAGFYRELETLLAGEADAKSRKALADGLFQLGELTEKIGDQKEALAVYRRALAIRRNLAAVPGADLETRLAVAVTLRRLGNSLDATVNWEGALRAYEESREFATALEVELPTAEVRQALAGSHIGIGNVLSATGKLQEALASYEKALDINQKLADANPAVTKFQSDLANSQFNIGLLLSQTGKPAEALASYRKARDINQKLADANPTFTQFQSDLARSHNSIGYALRVTGKPVEALASYEKARDINQKLADANPAVTSYQSDLAGSHHSIGWLLSKTGKPADTLASHEKAQDIYQKLADANPTVTRFQSDLAWSHNNIGIVLSDTGKPAEALVSYEKARDIQQKLADANPTVTQFQSALASSHYNIGNLLSKTGKPAEALASYEKARDIQQQLADANPAVTIFQRDHARSHNAIGYVLSQTGKPADALASYEKARDINQKLADANPTVTQFQSDLARSHNSIGYVLSQTGKPAEALASYEKARDINQKLADANPTVTQFQSDLAYSHRSIGSLQLQAGKPADALASHEKARDINQKLADADPTVTRFQSDLAYSHRSIGSLQLQAGKPADALTSYKKARDISQKLADANPTVTQFQSDLADSHRSIGSLQLQAGKPADALASYEKARDIQQKLADANPTVTRYQSDLAYSLYSIACCYAVASGKNAGKPEIAKTETDKAMDSLRKAVSAGYTNAAYMKKDANLDPLRERDDFKKLMTELEKSAPKPPEKK